MQKRSERMVNVLRIKRRRLGDALGGVDVDVDVDVGAGAGGCNKSRTSWASFSPVILHMMLRRSAAGEPKLMTYCSACWQAAWRESRFLTGASRRIWSRARRNSSGVGGRVGLVALIINAAKLKAIASTSSGSG